MPDAGLNEVVSKRAIVEKIMFAKIRERFAYFFRRKFFAGEIIGYLLFRA